MKYSEEVMERQPRRNPSPQHTRSLSSSSSPRKGWKKESFPFLYSNSPSPWWVMSMILCRSYVGSGSHLGNCNSQDDLSELMNTQGGGQFVMMVRRGSIDKWVGIRNDEWRRLWWCGGVKSLLNFAFLPPIIHVTCKLRYSRCHLTQQFFCDSCHNSLVLAVAAVTVQCACTSLVFLCFSFLCNAEEELHQNLGKGGCFTLQNNNLRKMGSRWLRWLCMYTTCFSLFLFSLQCWRIAPKFN